MQLSITPEQVDQFVRDAIIKSAVGGSITEAITKILNDRYNSPVEAAVKTVVQQTIHRLLDTEYKPLVETAVRAALDARVSKETLQKIANQAIESIERAARDRD